MRTLLLPAFVFALAALPARASACASGWRVDHYVYDAALHKNWAVLVNCAHPAEPDRMQITARTDANIAATPGARSNEKPRVQNAAPDICIKAGAAVEVSNPASSLVNMELSGTAMQSASRGQTIRVRLNPEGYFVHAIVRGPHAVELVAEHKPSWRQP